MKNSNEKSLKIINESILDKIKRFINRILNIQKPEIEACLEQNKHEEKESFVQRITNKEQETEELIKRIETEEIKIEETKDEELEQINTNLARYLAKIQKEIETKETERNIVENEIKSYKEQMEKYKERMAN